MGKIVSLNLNRYWANLINKTFAKVYKVDLKEAEKPINEYACLQDFFIRRLKPGLRPMPLEKNVVVSPCDGTLSLMGKIEHQQLLQVKGKRYSVKDLLGHTEIAQYFLSGHYVTLYLSPRDYHRFHVPMDGVIEETIYIPGTLWPVNHWGIHHIKDLFCQNERVISVIRHLPTRLKLAHIAIGATMVGKIELAYCQLHAEQKKKVPVRIMHEPMPVEKGQELGQFMFGSTIILLLESGLIDGFVKETPASVKMGEILGYFAKNQ